MGLYSPTHAHLTDVRKMKFLVRLQPGASDPSAAPASSFDPLEGNDLIQFCIMSVGLGENRSPSPPSHGGSSHSCREAGGPFCHASGKDGAVSMRIRICCGKKK